MHVEIEEVIDGDTPRVWLATVYDDDIVVGWRAAGYTPGEAIAEMIRINPRIDTSSMEFFYNEEEAG